MDCFQYSETPFDERMSDAMEIIYKKRNKNNAQNLLSKYPRKAHFEMEMAGKPSRWHTFRALRIFKKYEIPI